MKKITKGLSPVQIIMVSFLMVIMAGSVLLSLPISSANHEAVPYVDALFTSATSTCVTGLVTLPTVSSWSIFGQVVILVLIQIGGMGVITVVTGFLMLMKKRFGIEDRILIGESFNLNSLEGIVRFVKKVIKITLLIEGIGAVMYMTVFVPQFGAGGIWISVFTSVSAFCNAGLDIISQSSLCDYALNPLVNLTTMLLIVFGGIGFVVLLDLEKLVKSTNRRHFRFLTLHSKIALSTTFFMIVIGGVLFFVFEYNNPLTIGEYSVPQKIMASLFQSVTTRTAGFATIPQENFTDASSFVSIFLMFVGGSPAGTAGGIKTVTFCVLLISAISVIKNKRTVDVFNRQLSLEATNKSVAVFAVSFFIVICSTILISASGSGDFLDILFETVSATATVGLTRDFTSSLNLVGKIIIIMTMYLGRVGPISLAFAFGAGKQNENIITNPIEKINVG